MNGSGSVLVCFAKDEQVVQVDYWRMNHEADHHATHTRNLACDGHGHPRLWGFPHPPPVRCLIDETGQPPRLFQ